jgi:hypothetical protein
MFNFSKFARTSLLLTIVSFSLSINTLKAETYFNASGLSGCLALGLLFGGASVGPKLDNFKNYLTNKLIDSWLEKNNFNNFGDPKDTMYTTCPLAKNETHYNFLKNKFPKQPWLKAYKPVFNIIKSIDRVLTTMCCSVAVMVALMWIFELATKRNCERFDIDAFMREVRYKTDAMYPTYDAGYVC